MTTDESLAPRAASRTVLAGLALVLAFGTLGRCMGQTTIQLWVDEADWAMRAAEGNDTFIRPAGSMWLARQLIAVHNSEFTLRLPSLVAGIATLPLLFVVLRRLVRPGVALVGVLALVAHPVAVGMTKEFKPYAVEAALHLLVLLLALRLLHRPSPRGAAALALTTTFAPLFSWSIVFAYPGTFLVALRQRWTDWRGAGATTARVVVGAMLTTLVMLGALFAARIGGEDRKAEYWGNKYNVFYVDDDAVGQVWWTITQLRELVRWPLRLDLPMPWRTYIASVGFLLALIGLVALLARRRWTVLTLLAVPFATTVLFNVLGQWPWGLFRTNFYLLPLLLIIAMIGLDEVATGLERLHPRLVMIGGATVALLALAAAPRWWFHFDEKIKRSQTGQSQVRTAIGLLRAAEERQPTSSPTARATLLLDNHACHIFRYYKDHHTETKAAHRDWLESHIAPRCVVPNSDWVAFLEAATGESFWVMNVPRPLQRETAARLRKRCAIRDHHKLGNTSLLYCAALPEPSPAPAPPATPPSSAPIAAPAAPDAADDDDDDSP